MAASAAEKTGKRKRRSSAEIMTRLIRAAGEEFRNSGYRGATTAAIARRAEITEAQLFRYFDSKSDLFREAIFRPLSEDLAAFNEKYMVDVGVDEDAREPTRRYIAELQDFIADRADLFMVLIVAQAYAPDGTPGVGAVDSLLTYFERNAATMTRRLGKNTRIDPQLMVRVSFASVLASVMFRDWLFPPGLASEQAIADATIEFVMDGINANSGSRNRPVPPKIS